jgi:hypothetical protein
LILINEPIDYLLENRNPEVEKVPMAEVALVEVEKIAMAKVLKVALALALEINN